jgi:hypothetical protein
MINHDVSAISSPNDPLASIEIAELPLLRTDREEEEKEED